MSLWANIGGSWRKAVLWQNVGGTWRKSTLWQNIGGGWKSSGSASVAPLSASASPDYVYGSVSRAGTASVSTNVTTVSASGGTAPYTFAWGPQAGWTVTAPTSANTRFSTNVPAGGDKQIAFICTVTDAKGATTTASVTAEASNYYSGGGNAQIQ